MPLTKKSIANIQAKVAKDEETMKKLYKDVPVTWLKPKDIIKIIKMRTCKGCDPNEDCKECIKRCKKIFVSHSYRKGTERLCKKYFKVGLYKPRARDLKSRKSGAKRSRKSGVKRSRKSGAKRSRKSRKAKRKSKSRKAKRKSKSRKSRGRKNKSRKAKRKSKSRKSRGRKRSRKSRGHKKRKLWNLSDIRKSTAKRSRKTSRKSRKSRKSTKQRTAKRRSTKQRSRKKSPSKCKELLKQKIKQNIEEYKDGKYVSRQQAVAVSYSQMNKSYPYCRQHINRK